MLQGNNWTIQIDDNEPLPVKNFKITDSQSNLFSYTRTIEIDAELEIISNLFRQSQNSVTITFEKNEIIHRAPKAVLSGVDGSNGFMQWSFVELEHSELPDIQIEDLNNQSYKMDEMEQNLDWVRLGF